jgi:hypothetical protein
MRRVPEEVVRQMERPLLLVDDGARAEAAARLEAWAALVERAAAGGAPALGTGAAEAVSHAPEATSGEVPTAEERKRQAALLLQRFEALEAAPSVFTEESLDGMFAAVFEERSLKRKLAGK